MNKNLQYTEKTKKYKRIRLKWLFFFVLAGILLIAVGISKEHDKIIKEEEIEETNREEIIVEKNDFQYIKENPDIRVIIQSGNYSGMYHDKIKVSFPNGGYILTCLNDAWTKYEVKNGESIDIGIGGDFDYNITKNMTVVLISHEENKPIRIDSISRNRKVCDYYGRLEITYEDFGLLLVNTLSLEQYLCSVVPSEMPAGYDMEALKAQAILARTYAYKYLTAPAYPKYGAHVDDSISFQVYGNIDQNERTSKAVQDTLGIILFYENSLAEVYYYSTSCGFGSDADIWGGDSISYLQAKRIGAGTLKSEDGTLHGMNAEAYYLEALKKEQIFRNMITKPFVEGYEKEEAWYRWSSEDTAIEEEVILQRLIDRYTANEQVVLTQNSKGEFVSKAVKRLGKIKEIKILERGNGGICKSLLIEGTENTFKVLHEYNIRYVLNGNGTKVKRADGTEIFCSMLLPSGFFYIDTVHFGDNIISYHLYGGGYGHGVGMSQNGANRMAGSGLSCQDILNFFFPGTVLVSYDNAD